VFEHQNHRHAPTADARVQTMLETGQYASDGAPRRADPAVAFDWDCAVVGSLM
jgi:hypothetical protein